MRKRTTQSRTFRERDISGGLLRKIDVAKLPGTYARDARNVRFSTGVVRGRPGNARRATLSRPSGAVRVDGAAGNHLLVRRNDACPIWTGLGDFTVAWVERPVLNPATTVERWLLGVGDSGGASFALKVYSPSGAPLERRVAVLDTGMGGVAADVLVGEVDDDGGGTEPADRRYFFRIRRRGADLDVLVVGKAAGSVYTLHADLFSSATAKLVSSTSHLRIGAGGLDGTAAGLHSVIDELAISARWLPDSRKSYWSGAPLAEDPYLCLRLALDAKRGSIWPDSSLYENHAEEVGTVTAVGGEVEGLAVGQFIGELSAGGALHRVVAAGGSVYREVVRA